MNQSHLHYFTFLSELLILTYAEFRTYTSNRVQRILYRIRILWTVSACLGSSAPIALDRPCIGRGRGGVWHDE